MSIKFEVVPLLVFAAVILSWIAFVLVFVFREKPGVATEHKRDRGSVVGVLFQMLSYALVWSIRRQPFTPILRTNQAAEIGLAVITVAIAVGSIWIVMAAVKTLGKEWSVTARVVEGHQLATQGPYRFVRHPIYTSMLGMLLATGLAMSHRVALLLGVLAYLIGTAIRIRSEERLLREQFGVEFEDYVSRVPAILPGVY